MNTSQIGPAPHAGLEIDQTTRVFAGVGGKGLVAPGKDNVMEGSLKRARIFSIQFAVFNLEISLRPRRVADPGASRVRAAERSRLKNELYREREANHARLLIGG